MKRSDNMQRVLKNFTGEFLPHIQNKVLTTTLYELIEAINEEVKAEEKRFVSEIVIELLKTCRSNCWVQ